jgi:hypothetical protein
MTHSKKPLDSNFRWALLGSTLYEIIAMAHRTVIFGKLDLASYGLLVSILSITSIASHIGDFGASNSLSPFLHVFLASKRNFKKMLLHFTLPIHIPLMLISTAFVMFFWCSKLPALQIPEYFWILTTLIIIEIPQAFMRQFLYATQHTRTTVITETTLLLTRITTLWSLNLLFNYPLTLKLILYSHLASAALCALIFFIALVKLHNTLQNSPLSIPNSLGPTLAYNRFFSYTLRLSRNLFTSTTLTPIFALIFDLKTAGIFYFAGKLVKVVQSVVRIAIGYSGNGLLARVKNHALQAKQAAFQALSENLMRILLPVFICFALNSKSIGRFGYAHECSHEIFTLTLLFLIINFFDCVVLLYEQFYIMEEKSDRFFILKITEMCILYGIIMLQKHTSAELFLTSLIVTKIVSFLVVGLDAYKQWRILPTFTTNYQYVGGCVAFSLLFMLIL